VYKRQVLMFQLFMTVRPSVSPVLSYMIW